MNRCETKAELRRLVSTDEVNAAEIEISGNSRVSG
jgi:hypothetical protein